MPSIVVRSVPATPDGLPGLVLVFCSLVQDIPFCLRYPHRLFHDRQLTFRFHYFSPSHFNSFFSRFLLCHLHPFIYSPPCSLDSTSSTYGFSRPFPAGLHVSKGEMTKLEMHTLTLGTPYTVYLLSTISLSNYWATLLTSVELKFTSQYGF